MKTLIPFFLLWLGIISNSTGQSLREKLLSLSPASPWVQTMATPLQFNAFHTQGLVKIGDYFYLSSVEVTRWPKAYDQPQGKLDRDTGTGRGHLFKFDRNGKLIEDLLIGEGDIYHPGGIDYDGKYIWVPVTEYRPHSYSIIYKIDPQTMGVTEVLRYDDSIGAIVHNTDDNTLVGVNWDAREFYHWRFNKRGQITNASTPPDKLGIKRGSYYVAYQDCKYIGQHLMLCSGLQKYNTGTVSFRLGGWDIIDLRDNRPVYQIPVRLWSPSGAVMTNNPCAVESTKNGLCAYFIPDDDLNAVLFVYEINGQ